MKKNQVTVKKAAKKATVDTALIEALVQKDLASLAAGDANACCGGPTCITNCR